MSNPIYQFLHTTHLDALVNLKQEVSTLKNNQTVEDAVRLLSNNKILSAPIVDAKTGKAYAMVDMLDIVSHILRVAPDPLNLKENELRSLEIAGRAMAFAELKEITDLSGRNPFVPVSIHDTVTRVVEYFANGIHRTPVLSQEENLVGIVSQSSVVNFLKDHMGQGHLKDIGNKTVKDLGLGAAGVESIHATGTVLMALHKIQKTSFSALAIIDGDGKLVGNFSVSDLRGLFREHFPMFLGSVTDYLTKHSEASLSPSVVRADTTLTTLIKEMATNKLHRVWIIDSDFKPTGVVSLTDIMNLIVNYKEI